MFTGTELQQMSRNKEEPQLLKWDKLICGSGGSTVQSDNEVPGKESPYTLRDAEVFAFQSYPVTSL